MGTVAAINAMLTGRKRVPNRPRDRTYNGQKKLEDFVDPDKDPRDYTSWLACYNKYRLPGLTPRVDVPVQKYSF